MKTLLQINVSANSGSIGIIAEEIGSLVMKEEGWDSYIAYGRRSTNSNNKLIRIGKKPDFIRHAIETRLFDNHGFASKYATLKFLKIIDAIKPDIIHLHNLHGYYINIDILFKYLSQKAIPVVWTLHDCWAFTGHCSHFDSINCTKWETACYKCEKKHKYPQSLLLDSSNKNFFRKKHLFHLVDNLILVSVSNWLAGQIRKSFLNDNQLVVIHNGVNTNTFMPATNIAINKEKKGFKNKFVIIGVANVWNESKVLYDFFKLSKIIDNDCIIILVGVNKKQMKKLPGNIIGVGRTENKMELANLYSVADICMNLSIQESFGLTSIESMACGTPVLVYNKTALPEIVNNDVGWIIQAKDFNTILNVIKMVKNENPQNTYNRRLKCRDYVVGNFDKNLKYKEYIKLYQKLLRDNNYNSTT